MPKNLVVVESPAKARTIERYLGPDYRVVASYGHVRDLPENPGRDKLGVDIEHDFRPEYVVVDDRKKQVATIAREAKSAEAVYLATDLDREGEAIAWHVVEAAKVPAAKRRRVTFSEITEGAIRNAFAHPRAIDEHLVDAQQTRRILDRLVGYTLSPLLWRKIRRGLSAGRVQSVAVRLVVEREREIRGFTPREYWTLEATLSAGDDTTFTAAVVKHDGASLEIADEEAARRHAAALEGGEARVRSVATTRRKRNPAPPFTTSTLQQEASRKLGFSPKRTMGVAQRLYEGVETPEGQVGLITYMRTDSTALADVAIRDIGALVRERYGEPYAVEGGRRHRTKAKGAQEAHESIRPTSAARDPEVLEGHLGRDEGRLYRLIWQRAVASQMAAKEQETTTIELEAGAYELRASATRTVFDGFARVYIEGRDEPEEEGEATLPALGEGDLAAIVGLEPSQHFTEAPPRYTEATLIRALEEHGIGRPSTYAATISTILDRGYVTLADRRLRPELLGEIVTDLLVAHFGEFVDVAFTARMEEELDEIARGERPWVPVVRAFYGPFSSRVEEKSRELRPAEIGLATDEVCSLGHPMVIRAGRYGEFLACSLYPEHKETRPLPAPVAGDGTGRGGGDGTGSASGEAGSLEGVGDTCPRCGEGTLVARRGRFGPFAGCSRYPECDYIRKTGPPPPDPLPFEATCPRCGEGHLVTRVARRSGARFWGCSRYPRCQYTTSFEPLGALHDADSGPVARKDDGGICLLCGAPVELPEGDLVGLRLPGGEPDPGALARPRALRRGRRAGPDATGSGKAGEGRGRPRRRASTAA
ncbi:MAG TPA: type I DNA topoisomerase [Candidatus Limnocylindrales bacterium]|jgi:DNA topoisomerase-1|nr:type I DNA topoisomerase [Candidatus Limnocylindrales bacterium]